MLTETTPGPKKKGGEWQDICLSPMPAWTPAPGAVHLAEDENISPSSIISPSYLFSFNTPRQYSFVSPSKDNSPRQHGYLAVDAKHTRKHSKISVAVLVALFWGWGAWSWSSLQEQSRDPTALIPPQDSLSGVAKEAFANLYQRDWGAEPALWVILEASTSKRARVVRDERPDDSHSFSDDTSLAYEEGKHFCYDLAEYLEEKFQSNGTPSVRVTSYYHLDEQGLDYIARHLLSVDGAKTMMKIEYLPQEMGKKGVQRLKKSIVEFAKQNEPSCLDIQYTGQTWSYEPNETSYTLPSIGFALTLAGIFAKYAVGARHQFLSWALVVSASMATTLSVSAIILIHLVRTVFAPMTMSALVALSFVLSASYSKLQLDSGIEGAKEAISRSGGILICLCAVSSQCLPSPMLQSISTAATVATLGCVCFHLFLASHMIDEAAPVKHHNLKAKTSRFHSILALCITAPFFMYVACQVTRLNETVLNDTLGGANKHFLSIGASMGHGQLTHYRVLFDGHKRNQSMVSLNGYDIMQMVVDELRGISLSETGDSEESGATHVGESFTEVQSLIKSFIRHLKRLRDEQQRQFDLHHQRRQEHWRRQQDQEETDIEDFRCDYNVNKLATFSGIAVLENRRIPQSLYSAANICRGMEPRCPSEALHLLNVLADSTTTSNHLATFVTVNLGVDPFSKDGSNWLSLARETVRRLQADPRILGGVEIHIDGPAASYHDSQNDQRERLPSRVALVAGITMFVLAISFGSVFVPLRLLLTLGTTGAVSLGAGVLIYKDGVLNWTRIHAMASSNELESSFELPLVCLLTASVLLVSECSFSKHEENRQSLGASMKLVALCLALFSWGVATVGEHPVRWPVLVVINICVEAWVRRTVWPVVASLPLVRMKSQSQNQRSRLRCVRHDSDMERNNQAYLAKFDKLLKSPQAP